MLLQLCIATTSECLRAIETLNIPKKYIYLLGGLSSIDMTCQRRAQDLIWGTRGPFLLAAAMVVAVLMPVVFVLRLLNNVIKTIKLV